MAITDDLKKLPPAVWLVAALGVGIIAILFLKGSGSGSSTSTGTDASATFSSELDSLTQAIDALQNAYGSGGTTSPGGGTTTTGGDTPVIGKLITVTTVPPPTTPITNPDPGNPVAKPPLPVNGDGGVTQIGMYDGSGPIPDASQNWWFRTNGGGGPPGGTSANVTANPIPSSTYLASGVDYTPQPVGGTTTGGFYTPADALKEIEGNYWSAVNSYYGS